MTSIKWCDSVMRCLLCASMCWGLSLPAQAVQADPTEAAFGALLAMPASGPVNGTWDHYAIEAPADFDGEAASQDDLIAYLDGQRKKGARFDSYRLQGTLFHHAVRARLQKVALWLLQHGANPSLKLEGATELDGMGIAIKVGAWRVFDALRKHPAYATLSKEALSQRYIKLVNESPEALRALLDRKLWVSGTPQVQEGLTGQLTAFLIQGRPGDALTLLDVNAGFAPASLSCGNLASNKPEPSPNMQATPEQWRMTVERLPANLRTAGWLCAFRFATSKDNAQAMLAASGTDPWRDPQFAVQAARLSFANAAWIGRLRDIPSASLTTALSNTDFQQVWLRGIATLPLADLQWALSLVKPVMTTATAVVTIGHWRQALGSSGKTQVPDSVERWRLLAQAAPPGGGEAVGALVYLKPVAVWATWLAKGYVLPQAELKYWLRDQASISEIAVVYPFLQTHAPILAKQALMWLVEPLSGGDGYWGPDQLAKAELLERLGARVEKPYPLAAVSRSTGAKGQADLARDAAVAKAVQRGWVLDVPESQRPVVEVVKELGCKPVVSAAMRLSIAGWGRWRAPKAYPYDVDPSLSDVVPLPSANGEGCRWFATGGEQPGRKFIYDLDFFEGVNRLTPCADGNVVNAVWDEIQGDWVNQNGMQVFGAIYRLRVKNSKNEALLEWQDGGGGCRASTGTGVVYSVNGKNKKFELVSAERGNPVYDALVQQCDLSRLEDCLAFSEPQAAIPPLSWSAQYLPDERRAFLAALNRFDPVALNKAKTAGLFADWVQSGLRQVGESALSLEDKRKRAAWLLAQRTLLANALDSETIASLLRWLPAQDWQPVMYTVRCEHGNLKYFTEAVTAAKREDLLQRAPATCAAVAKK